MRAFAGAGPSSLNELPVELRDLTFGPATFAKTLVQSEIVLMEFHCSSLCNIL